ncbi:hypothetical protein MW887_003462 [Aspergillus wentii]|nr:hypothetical protein MW887_003462 [Aspergillus wentii]
MSTELARRLQTSLGGFSEITAVSQRAINAGLVKLVKEHPELAHVKCKSKAGHYLDAEIEQPLISLKVTGASRAGFEYMARVGKVDYEIKGWTVAFNVQIDLATIEPGSAEDKEVRGAIKQPGDYSLTSLFLTFNKGDIIKPNMKHCDFKGANLDSDDIITLGGILAKWFVDEGPMIDRRKRTVAYGLHTAKPDTVNADAPSFPPTSLKLQTYEYIAPGEDKPKEGLENGRNNMLLYLQMTDSKKFPSEPILPYSENFVSDGMDGTMCIEKEIFWDRYLLRTTGPRLLHLFNNATYAWVKSTNLSQVTEPDWEIGIGDGGHGDMNFFNWAPSTDGSMSWTWGDPPQDEQHKITKETHGRLEITCTTKNRMEAQPGSNIIDLSGKTNILADGGCGGGMSAPWACSYKVHVWLEWQTKVTLNAVEDGGFSLSLDLAKNNFKVGADEVKTDCAMAIGVMDRLVKACDKMKTQLEDSLAKAPLHDIAAKLQTDLNNSARFVVPGKGTFKYQNPVFNNNGDVMIEVGYK